MTTITLESAKGEDDRANAAEKWLEEWSGTLEGAELAVEDDLRIEGILGKHLR